LCFYCYNILWPLRPLLYIDVAPAFPKCKVTEIAASGKVFGLFFGLTLFVDASLWRLCLNGIEIQPKRHCRYARLAVPLSPNCFAVWAERKSGSGTKKRAWPLRGGHVRFLWRYDTAQISDLPKLGS